MSLSKEELAYMAGFFDGEGSIFMGQFRQTKGRKRSSFQPKIRVGNTVPEALELFMKIPVKWFEWTQIRADRDKPMYYINLSKQEDILKALKMLLPYLHLKRRDAELMIRFCEMRIPKLKYPVCRKAYTEEEKRVTRLLQHRALKKRLNHG